MAIVSVKQSFRSNEGDQTLDGGLRIVRSFDVLTSAPGDGALTVLTASGIPAIGASYTNGTESSSALILKRKTPRRHSDQPLLWSVDCEYSEQTIEGEGADAGLPTAQPVKLTWQTLLESVDLEVDANGLPVQNTAGDPLEAGGDRPTRSLTIERNVDGFNAAELDAFLNTTNQMPYAGYDTGEGRIVSIDASGEFDAIYGGYYALTIEIHFRKSSVWVPTIPSAQLLPAGVTVRPWDIILRNKGTRERPAASEEPIVSTDEHGLQVTEGVDLDDDGTRLGTSDDPFYLVFARCKLTNWGPLELPDG